MHSGSYHQPVMLPEVLELLAPSGSGLWLDGTCGGGGHSRAIADRLNEQALLLGIDRDPAAIEATKRAMEGARCQVALERAHLGRVGEVLDRYGGSVRGAILDLGLSSSQLDRPGRGFSFRDTNSSLDMRQDPDQQTNAGAVVNQTPQNQLADLIFRGSDERFSRRIAGSIVRSRPLVTVGDLVEAVQKALPRGYRSTDDVLRRVFQSIRMAVGQELEQLEQALAAISERLEPAGTVVVLSYHSGEDGAVKRFFRARKIDGSLQVLTPKPLRPTEEEIRANSRSRPARLRAARRI